MKLAAIRSIGETLSRDELKKVFGGDSYDSGSGWDWFCHKYHIPPKICACYGKKSGDSCHFIDDNDAEEYGRCVYIYSQQLHCSDTN